MGLLGIGPREGKSSESPAVLKDADLMPHKIMRGLKRPKLELYPDETGIILALTEADGFAAIRLTGAEIANLSRTLAQCLKATARDAA